MVPARQCFKPDNPAGFDVNLRLVMQGKAAALDGGHKFSAEDDALARVLVERLVMKAGAIAAGILCAIKREIGLHKHGIRSVQFLGVARNADAG